MLNRLLRDGGSVTLLLAAAGVAAAAGFLFWFLKRSRKAPAQTSAMARLRERLPDYAALVGWTIEDQPGEGPGSRMLTLRFTWEGAPCWLRFREEPMPGGSAGPQDGREPGSFQDTGFRFKPARDAAAFCLTRSGGAPSRSPGLGPAREVGAGGLIFQGSEQVLARLSTDARFAELLSFVAERHDRVEAGSGFVEWVVTGLPDPQKNIQTVVDERREFARWWNKTFST